MPVRTRWALVLVGAWIMGSIASSVVAAENFYTIDRLLASTSNLAFSRAVQQLGQPQARDLLRYLSSELNRRYFQMWNVAQVPIGGLALWLVATARPRDARARRVDGVLAAMVAIAALMLVWLTPQIVSLGRLLDFVPREPAPPGMARFWVLHGAYTSLEFVKLVLGLYAAYALSASDTPRALEYR